MIARGKRSSCREEKERRERDDSDEQRRASSGRPGHDGQEYAESMRAAVALTLAVAALAAGGAAATAVPAPTFLRISYWEDGSKEVDAVWTLRCNPPRGTLQRPARACRKLARGGLGLFAPVPPGMACTEIYGGPQKARVVGTVAGKRVRATFARTNGCEISRWDALTPWLLPRGGVR